MSSEKKNLAATHLRWSARTWFAVVVIGQLAFVTYILAFFGVRTFTGNYEGWNDSGLITGYVAGDWVGNMVFASHVLLAAIITLGGLFQLIPILRRRYPAAHRLNGRLFLLLAVFMALGGLWATWIRGSHLSVISGLSVSLNGILILIFAAFTIHYAVARNIEVHERWAMRLFMVVSGVWFFRIGILAWFLINQGPVGMNETISGPADIGLSIGSYLVPLVSLELYLRARESKSVLKQRMATLMMAVFTCITAIGVGGATMFMWMPRIIS